MSTAFITTSIPYVNGRPHLGHALELVQTDVLARHARGTGAAVRFQTGTDDNALKNVRSAEAAGLPTQEFVDRVAGNFATLATALDVAPDDVLRTSTDPRHRPAVERIWRACAANGDLYRKAYTGRYCVGCEAFYRPADLVPGPDGPVCPEHGVPPEPVREENWFFRLGRYQDRLAALIRSGELRIVPETRRREVLSFVEAGLEDFSVSRSVERARGWGVPVPDDPGQVVYVWFDALTNYLSGPGYGTDDASYAQWWAGADRRTHVIGKGIIRFHAVYWPAMLLSAGVPLPHEVLVHEYVTADGTKIGKSTGPGDDPVDVVAAYGADALRWWLLRDVARTGDTDYTTERLVLRANEDLAHNLGNLVHRTVSMVGRYRAGAIPAVPADPDVSPGSGPLRATRAGAPDRIAAALDDFDFRRAASVVLDLGDAANRYVEAVRPWELARAERSGAGPEALDAALGELVAAARDVARLLSPFLPRAAAAIAAQLGDGGPRVAAPAPVFPRLEEPVPTAVG